MLLQVPSAKANKVMFVIGLIREGKVPADNRVALIPAQCRMLQNKFPDIKIIVQPSVHRCYSDSEYLRAGVLLSEDLSECNVLLGIKEVPVADLIANKTYLIFSHTRKKQPHNRFLLKAIIEKNITLIDYECLEHEDGQRIIGFGFFAGIVGAHNGMMAYGKRTGSYNLCRVGECKSYQQLIHTYFGLKLPNVKIAVTGSGRVASGVLEIMNLLDIAEVEPDEYKQRAFTYPVFVHLKGRELYYHAITGKYVREDFHNNPQQYNCHFVDYVAHTDILMNGIYWEMNSPKLFSWHDMLKPHFRIQTIADITNDTDGSIPCNLGDSTIEDPVYGVDTISRQMVDPYQKDCIDVMAVSNLPNELPRDASRFFGQQLIKYILDDLRNGGSKTIDRATIVKHGKLTTPYNYLHDYAVG